MSDPIRCNFCKKELDPEHDEIAVVQSDNFKILYFCKEHKGLRTESQFFAELVLKIMDEPFLKRAIADMIQPFVEMHSKKKISYFLYDNQKRLEPLFSEKYNGHYKDLDHKCRLMAKILRTDLPNYKMRYEKENVPTSSVIWEPGFEKLKTSPRKAEHRETMQEKKDRLARKMEETPSPKEYKGFFDQIKEQKK